MKRVLAFFMCLLLVCASAAMGEDYWVDENWQQINREIDCDGLQLVVDAQVLQVPEGTMVQEYHTNTLSNEFMKEKMKATDWLALGVDTSNGTWRLPTKDWSEYTYTNGVTSVSLLAAINTFTFQKCNVTYARHSYRNSGVYQDTVDLSPIGTLTEVQIREAAEKIAKICGVQFGQPKNAFRQDQVEVVRDAIEYGNDSVDDKLCLNPEDAEEYLFMWVEFPVYFQGLRLYSGSYGNSINEEMEIPYLCMQVIVTKNHGMIWEQCPVFDPDDFVATTEPQRALNAEEMIDSISEQFANMYLPGVKQVTLNRLALEYAALAGDVSASKGYTVYPVWVASYTYIMEREDRAPVMVYYGYDAITGQRMF